MPLLSAVAHFAGYGAPTEGSDLFVGILGTHRAISVFRGNALYLGMANPMNLLTDLTDDIPEGGWELIQLSRR